MVNNPTPFGARLSSHGLKTDASCQASFTVQDLDYGPSPSLPQPSIPSLDKQRPLPPSYLDSHPSSPAAAAPPAPPPPPPPPPTRVPFQTLETKTNDGYNSPEEGQLSDSSQENRAASVIRRGVHGSSRTFDSFPSQASTYPSRYQHDYGLKGFVVENHRHNPKLDGGETNQEYQPRNPYFSGKDWQTFTAGSSSAPPPSAPPPPLPPTHVSDQLSSRFDMHPWSEYSHPSYSHHASPLHPGSHLADRASQYSSAAPYDPSYAHYQHYQPQFQPPNYHPQYLEQRPPPKTKPKRANKKKPRHKHLDRYTEETPRLLKRKPEVAITPQHESGTITGASTDGAPASALGHDNGHLTETAALVAVSLSPMPLWPESEKQEAIKLVAQLSVRGMSPAELVEQGVNRTVVELCCKELGIPFQLSAQRQQPEAQQPADANRSSQLLGAASRTASAIEQPLSEEARSTRETALESLRKRALASKLVKGQSEEDPLAAASIEAYDPSSAPPSVNSVSGPNASLDHQLNHSSDSSSDDSDDVSMMLEDSEGDGDESKYGPQSASLQGNTTPQALPSRKRGYRDVDAPQEIQEIDDFSSSQGPSRRQRISYADMFSRKPETPSGEVDLNAPLPSLPIPQMTLPSTPSSALRDHTPNYASDMSIAGSWYPSANASRDSLRYPYGDTTNGARKRPLAADFEGMASSATHFESGHNSARAKRFLHLPHRARMVIDVSDDDSDSDVKECSGAKATVESAKTRKQTLDALHALFLADQGLTVAATYSKAPSPKSLLDEPTLARRPTKDTIPDSNNSHRTGSADISNEELEKKEQDIKLLLMRIKELEKKKQKQVPAPPTASSLFESEKIDSKTTPTLANGKVEDGDDLDDRSLPKTTDEIKPKSVGKNPVASRTTTLSLGIQPTTPRLDPKLSAQREMVLASLRAKRSSGSTDQAAALIGTSPSAFATTQTQGSANTPEPHDAEISSSVEPVAPAGPTTRTKEAAYSSTLFQSTDLSAASFCEAANNPTKNTLQSNQSRCKEKQEGKTDEQEQEQQRKSLQSLSSSSSSLSLFTSSLPSSSAPTNRSTYTPYVPTLLQNMTEKFKNYISPLSRFPSLLMLTKSQSTVASSSSSSISSLPSAPSSFPEPELVFSNMVHKRWCKQEASGSQCKTDDCNMLHAQDLSQDNEADSSRVDKES